MSLCKKMKKGFTLVEVLVVAVIIAILAAVGVPLYMNYVKDARKGVAENAAGEAANLYNTCRAIGKTPTTDARQVSCSTLSGQTSSYKADTTVTLDWSVSGEVKAIATNGTDSATATKKLQ